MQLQESLRVYKNTVEKNKPQTYTPHVTQAIPLLG